MTNEQRVRLWDEINRYVQTCGGDPSKHVYGNTRRQKAVAEIETIIAELAPSAEVVSAMRAVVAGYQECSDPLCDYESCHNANVQREWLAGLETNR